MALAGLPVLTPPLSEPADAAGPERPTGGPVEVAALRSRDSRTLRVDDHYRAEVFPGPIHYQDANGAWQPIDNTLVSAGAAGSWRNRANDYHAEFPSDLGAGPVRVAKGDAWVSFALTGGKGAGRGSGSAVTYPEALPGVSVTYAAGNDRLKETLTLAGPSAPSQFDFELAASPGLVPKPAGRGIDLVSASGQRVFHLLAPHMDDAAGAHSEAVSMAVAPSARGWRLTLVADKAWLADADRAWPVAVDPTVTISQPADTAGCYLASASPTTSLCGATNLNVGFDGTHRSRSLLTFKSLTQAVPYDSMVLKAELQASLAAANSTSTSIGVNQVTRAWTGAATWSSPDGSASWSAPGGDFAPTSTLPVTIASAPSGTAVRWYPTALVQSWVNGGAANHGLLLKQPSEATANTVSLVSWNSTDSTRWPRLTVDYSPRWGPGQNHPSFRHRLNDRMELSVNVANGNLMVQSSDLQVAGTGLDLIVERYYNSLRAFSVDDLGYGWLFGSGGDVWLSAGSDRISLNFSGGQRWVFLKKADGTHTSAPGSHASVAANADGTHTLSFHQSGQKLTFAPQNPACTAKQFATELVDRNDNKVTYTYDTASCLSANNHPLMTSVTDTQGRVTTFSRDYYMTSVTDSTGRAAATPTPATT